MHDQSIYLIILFMFFQFRDLWFTNYYSIKQVLELIPNYDDIMKYCKSLIYIYGFTDKTVN